MMENNVPTKTIQPNKDKPWINTSIKRLIRKKKKWFKKFKSCSSERVKNKYLTIKKTCQRECRKAHNNYVKELVTDETPNNKRLWQYIKSKNTESVTVGELLYDNEVYTDPIDKANILNNQFCSVFTEPNGKTKEIDENSFPNIENIKVSEPGVKKLLDNINVHKSTGPDEIPGRLLKQFSHFLSPVYAILFQASLDQGIVPSDWKLANIVPLFKKGDRSIPENYRPISLTSISCKLLEHIIYSNIMKHLKKFNILSDAQHGFRQGRSCESQLITTTTDFINSIDKKGHIDAILLDFSKAFDKVCHPSFFSKLKSYGIQGNCGTW